ncbi:MAG: hypothetical protein AAGD14_17045 [Planctomycetota bacterium]
MRTLGLTLLLLAGAASAEDVGGRLTADTTWRGTVEIVEDVIVPDGVTLTIEPGTTVIPARDVIGEGKGWNPRSLEIHVHGRIVAHGTPSRRIRIGPLPDENEDANSEATWSGIVFHPDRVKPSRLIWCSIRRAEIGLQVCGRELLIEHVLFARCPLGIGVGILRSLDGKARTDLAIGTAPVIRHALFSQCGVGIANERSARPDVERSVFLDCKAGVGFGRMGEWYGPVRGVGTRLERCEFVRCEIGVMSSARISNCIFDRNAVGLRSSTAHSDEAVSIDRYRIDGVLAEGNGELLSGDLPPLIHLVRKPIGRSGDLPKRESYDPEALWGDGLAAVLKLADGSAGRGTATDGGDFGAFGAGRSNPVGAAAYAVKKKGVPVDSWLICGPPTTRGARDSKWPMKKLRRGMRGADFVWIGVADAVSQPRRPGGSLTRGPANPRYVAAQIKVEQDDQLKLVLALDGSVEAWWGGKPVLPLSNLRFETERAVDLPVTEGTHWLVLRLRPRRSGAPFAARITNRHGDRPTGVSCISQQRKPGRFAVRSVKVKKGKTDSYTLTVRFSGPVHWQDAIDGERYAVKNTDGVPYKLRFRRAEYVPKQSAVILHGVRRPYLGTFYLDLKPMRDQSGLLRVPDTKRAKFTLR